MGGDLNIEREKLVDQVREQFDAAMQRSAHESSPWLSIDLTMAQMKTLFLLHREDQRVGEIAQLLTLSSNATTALIDQLENQGFTIRRPDPEDRRAVLVALTDEGLAWVDERLSAHMRELEDVLEQLSLEELQALHVGMSALNRVLSAIDQANGQ